MHQTEMLSGNSASKTGSSATCCVPPMTLISRSNSWLLVIPLIMILMGATARAGDRASEVQNWFAEEVREAAKPLAFSGYSVSWFEDLFNVLGPAEVETLREAVKGHPEHPRRFELEATEKQIRDGKIRLTFRLFADGSGLQERWRYNRGEGATFVDSVFTPDDSWQLSAQSIALFDPAVVKVGADSQQAPQAGQRVFRSQIAGMLFGNLDLVTTRGLTPEPPTVSGDRWSIVCRKKYGNDAEARYTYEGRWSPADSRGFVESIKYFETGITQSGTTFTFADWKKNEPLGRWIAQAILRKDASGVRSREIVFNSIDPLPPGGFEAVVALPKLGSTDSVRGVVVANTFVDFAKNKRIIVDSDGSLSESKITDDVIATEGPARWTIVGWLLLGALVLTVVIVRFRNRSS